MDQFDLFGRLMILTIFYDGVSLSSEYLNDDPIFGEDPVYYANNIFGCLPVSKFVYIFDGRSPPSILSRTSPICVNSSMVLAASSSLTSEMANPAWTNT